MPDKVYPNNTSNSENIDNVYIYYRSDGDLYLYDTSLMHEFNLFNLEIPD